LLKEAITNDPTFTEAYILLSRFYGWSHVNYGLQLRDRESMQYLDLAAASKEKISLYDQISINQQRAYLEKNQEELIRANEQLVKLRPLSPQHWQFSALDYDHAHQFEKAVIAYEKAIELYKKVGFDRIVRNFIARLGTVYHELGNHEIENELYEEGLKINVPYSIDRIIYSQAVCALSQGDTTKANEHMAKYRSNKETEELEEYWIDYDIGMIHLDAEQYDKAVKIFSDLITTDPREPLIKWRLGFILIDKELDVDEGMELIDQALDIEPDNADFLYTKGLGYYKQGMVQEAFEIINKAWNLRLRYDHDHYLLLQEVKQALN